MLAKYTSLIIVTYSKVRKSANYLLDPLPSQLPLACYRLLLCCSCICNILLIRYTRTYELLPGYTTILVLILSSSRWPSRYPARARHRLPIGPSPCLASLVSLVRRTTITIKRGTSRPPAPRRAATRRPRPRRTERRALPWRPCL